MLENFIGHDVLLAYTIDMIWVFYCYCTTYAILRCSVHCTIS